VETQYKFIHFLKKEEKPKTSVWYCCNNKSDNILGEVKWYSRWRQYCYFSTVPAIYSIGCLEDINNFIQQLNKERHVLAEKELNCNGL